VSDEKRALGPTVIAGNEMKWSKGVVAGGFVFLAGTAGLFAEDGSEVRDIAGQTDIAFDRAEAALLEAGSELSKVVRINQYLRDREDHEAYVEARERWLTERAPQLQKERSYASILVIQELVLPDMKIEIEMTALA
jgi:enamine deaminase RidA (YjgF/YER057c/UK114 family)